MDVAERHRRGQDQHVAGAPASFSARRSRVSGGTAFHSSARWSGAHSSSGPLRRDTFFEHVAGEAEAETTSTSVAATLAHSPAHAVDSARRVGAAAASPSPLLTIPPVLDARGEGTDVAVGAHSADRLAPSRGCRRARGEANAVGPDVLAAGRCRPLVVRPGKLGSSGTVRVGGTRHCANHALIAADALGVL